MHDHRRAGGSPWRYSRRAALRGAAGTLLGMAPFVVHGKRLLPRSTDDTPPAPTAYQPLYAELARTLDALDQALAARWDGQRRPVAFSTDLLIANGNRGEALLADDTLAIVGVVLDHLAALGAAAVVIATPYPLLMPSFPRSDEYLAFYRSVAAAVRARGLMLIVETNTVFPDPEFSSLGVDYRGLTFDQFLAGKRAMVETIIREVHPDYLTILNEPGTQTRNTGLPLSVEDATALVRAMLDSLDRTGVQVGAGAGTWENLAYFQRFATDTDLDYLDMHIYPIQRRYVLDTASRVAAVAQATGKQLAISEAWLYKAGEAELTGQTGSEAAIFARDVFSFWAPLDVRFIELMGTLAHALDLRFCSFFWMTYFYAYLDYTETTSRLPRTRLTRLVNLAAFQNIPADAVTPAGAAFRRLTS